MQYINSQTCFYKKVENEKLIKKATLAVIYMYICYLVTSEREGVNSNVWVGGGVAAGMFLWGR